VAAEMKLLSHLYSRSIAAQFDQHGNCTTATVDTVVLGKFQACEVEFLAGCQTLCGSNFNSSPQYFSINTPMFWAQCCGLQHAGLKLR